MTTADYVLLNANIAEAEGNEGFAYDDATGRPLRPGDTLLGNLTVGMGWNLTARPLSPRVRAIMRDECVEEAQSDLRRTYPWFDALNGVRQAALIEIRFALGARGYRSFQKMNAALARGDFDGAARELVLSKAASKDWQPSRAARLVRMIKLGTP